MVGVMDLLNLMVSCKMSILVEMEKSVESSGSALNCCTPRAVRCNVEGGDAEYLFSSAMCEFRYFLLSYKNNGGLTFFCDFHINFIVI